MEDLRSRNSVVWGDEISVALIDKKQYCAEMRKNLGASCGSFFGRGKLLFVSFFYRLHLAMMGVHNLPTQAIAGPPPQTGSQARY